MNQRSFKNTIYKIASWLLGTSVFLITVIGGSLRIDLSDASAPGGVWGNIIGWLQNWGVVQLVFLGLIAAFSSLLKVWAGNPQLWNAIEDFVNIIREHVFLEKYNNEPQHHHRVTLFKYRKFKFFIWPLRGWSPWGKFRHPFSGWLVPVTRSGYATIRGGTTFLAPDDADDAEGIGGLCWQTGGMVVSDDLPELVKGSSSELFELYAGKTNTSEEFIEDRMSAGKVIPRSLCSIPIFTGKRRPWGVLVLDSRQPDAIKSPVENPTTYSLAQKLTGILLENS